MTNGEKYEGDWIDDKKNGNGKYIWPQNIQYEGTFTDDKKDGQGTLKFANGRMKQGIWRNDEFIDSQVEKSYTKILQERTPGFCIVL